MDGEPGVYKVLPYIWSCLPRERRGRSTTGRRRTEEECLRDMLEMRKVELWLVVGTRLGERSREML